MTSLLLGSISLFVAVHIFGMRRIIRLQEQLAQVRQNAKPGFSHVSNDK